MPYQIGSAPPGLRGFLLSRANQQAESQAEMQGIQGLLSLQIKQEQLRQAAEQAPLQRALLQAQVDSIPLQAKLREAQIAEAQRKSQEASMQSQARLGLAGLLGGNFAPGLTGVFTDREQALEAAKAAAARGEQFKIGVPNPANVQALSVLAHPQAAISSLMRQNAPQRGHVVGPGASYIPPGATQPAFTAPFAPKAEPLSTIHDPNSPTTTRLVPRSEAVGQPGPMRSANQSATKERMSDEAIRDLAIQSLYDSSVLAGYRRDTEAMSRIGNARIQVMKESGVTSQDVVSGRAGFKADTASLNKITPQYDAITAFEQTAVRNGEILKELATKVDKTGVPVVERWIRAGRQATGDPDVAKFNAQLHLYRAEAARILTQPNLSGILTDTAREEMAEFLKGGSSAQQIIQVVDLLKRDFLNRKQTLEEQIVNIRSRMNQRVAPGTATASPAAAPATAVPAAPANKKLIYDPSTGTFK